MSTYEHRTTDLSDVPIIFKPGTDLAILNYIANYIIQTGAAKRDFVDRHCNIRMANTDIGYGLRPEHVLEQRAQHANDAQVSHPSDFEAYAKLMGEYTADKVSELSGVPKATLESARQALRRPEDQGDVALDDGVQPARPRGVGEPHGLQPPPPDREDLGARQQPVLAHRAALGLRHGARGRHLLASPAGRHAGRQPRAPQARRAHLEAPGGPPVRQGRLPRRAAGPHAQGRQAQRLLDHVQQQPPDGAEHQQRDLSRLPQPGELRRGLRPLSDRHRDGGRPHPADRDVGREGGGLRERRAADPLLAPARQRARRGAFRPVAVDGVLQALHHRRGLAGGHPRQGSRISRQDALRCPFANGEANKFPLVRDRPGIREPRGEALRLLRPEGAVRGVCLLRPRARPRPRALRHLPPSARAALARGRRQGDAVALSRGPRPVRREGGGAAVLRQPRQEGEPDRARPTSRRRSRRTRSSTSGSSPGGCWSTGIPAR